MVPGMEKPKFDENRFQERVENIKTNLRNFARTACSGPEALLNSDELLARCIGPALEAYDEELGAMFKQYSDAVARIGR